MSVPLEKRLPFTFVPLPNSVYTDWMKDLTGSQIKVYMVIMAHTYAKKDKKTGKRITKAEIEIEEFMGVTGLSKSQVERITAELSTGGRKRNGTPKNNGLGLVKITGPERHTRTYEPLMDRKVPGRMDATTKLSVVA